MRVKNRNPFVTAVLSVVSPGLGQLYTGHPRHFVAIIGLALILSVGGKLLPSSAGSKVCVGTAGECDGIIEPYFRNGSI